MTTKPITQIDPRLKEYATATQAKYIDKINSSRSLRSAAIDLGVARSTVNRALDDLYKKAALRGYAPDHGLTRPTPSPFRLKGYSQYIDKDGVPGGQWLKATIDNEQHEQAIRAFVEHLVDDARGKSPYILAPQAVTDGLLCVYPMGDPHFGMYAWKDEAGEDFDLSTAERLAYSAVDRLVASAPSSRHALLLNLGDFFHADNSSNTTPQNSNPLDVDTRYAKVMQVGLRAMRHCIERLLEKHAEVEVWSLPGNHDPHASFALSLCLSAFFSNNPRVTVDLSPGMYKYKRFGKVLIGAHHGHGARMEKLPSIMAADVPQDWGLTSHRYWYCGHIHHRSKDKEHPGVMIETFRTLAPKDAWHAAKGYRSGRDMYMIVLHEKHGEIERHRCDIGMIDG